MTHDILFSNNDKILLIFELMSAETIFDQL